jgi:hypothetical protein
MMGSPKLFISLLSQKNSKTTLTSNISVTPLSRRFSRQRLKMFLRSSKYLPMRERGKKRSF